MNSKKTKLFFIWNASSSRFICLSSFLALSLFSLARSCVAFWSVDPRTGKRESERSSPPKGQKNAVGKQERKKIQAKRDNDQKSDDGIISGSEEKKIQLIYL